ncbi:MAG: CopD family protein [Acidimicrobiales bacterium]
MIRFDVHTVRLFLHVLGATVWVGGQLVLAGLVPVLRQAGPDAPRLAARRFALLSWPFFGLLMVTGVWNLVEINAGDRSSAYNAWLGVKILLAALSGVGAAIHSLARTPALRGATGGVGALAALAALLLGVVLVRSS